MDKLSDFKPLARIDLPKLGELETSGLILIVGPNSSGKSQLLRDIYHRVCGDPRELVVATDIRPAKPPLAPLIAMLEKEGLLERFEDNDGNTQYKPLTSFLGTGQPANQMTRSQPESWHQNYDPDRPGFFKRNSEFLNYFGRLSITALFLERRLAAVNQVPLYEFEAQPPQNELAALYLSDSARVQVLKEIQTVFSKSIWPDITKGTALCLRVNDLPELPSAEDRLSPKKMAKYRQIETEGDGLRSYLATCITLLLGRRPLCVLDEPELCLHPPQAYNLGRFIGQFGSSADHATFVATHSSHILRGVLQSAPKVQIVRLTRAGEAFEAHRVNAETLAEAIKKPTVRAETVLDGIFAQAVVVLEADSDRTVYQAAWETLQADIAIDVHFAAVGGAGGIADTVGLYRTLRIPTAILADLDVLMDRDRLAKILPQLCSQEMSAELLRRADDFAAEIKKRPPTVNPEEVRALLSELQQHQMDWSKGDDAELKGRLARMVTRLDRMRELKTGGIGKLPEELRRRGSNLLSDFETVGLFLVPVGELEYWLDGFAIKSSKEKKWAWANEAAAAIRHAGKQSGDIWDFTARISSFLRRFLGDTEVRQLS